MSTKKLSLQYRLLEGSLHQGGTAAIELIENPGPFKIKITYQLTKKNFVPIPHHLLLGEVVLELPPIFKDETGFLELERKKQMDIGKALLTHLGRRDYYEYLNGHLIQVSLHNGRGEAQVFYHPSLPSPGWGELTITIKTDLPLLNRYTLIAQIVS